MVFLHEVEFEVGVVWDLGGSSVLELAIVLLALSESDFFRLVDAIFQ